MIRQNLHFGKLIIYTAVFFVVFSCKADDDTTELVKDITGQKWHVWLDKSAPWANDSLYAPPVDINTIPSNKPTGGWQNLYEKTAVQTKLPCTVEELFSDGVNSWKYHGVSWFWNTVKIPKDWAKKNILLRIEKARLRLEVYINENLAGYDLVNGAFYEIDASKYLEPGKENTIAFRLTNPGGRRGWQDEPTIQWGAYELPASHDFSGIGGKVTLAAVPDIYVKNIHVKNLPPYKDKKVEIITRLVNKNEIKTSMDFNIDITDDTTGKTVYKTTLENINITGSHEQVIKKVCSVDEAKLWNIDNPNLYDFTVRIEDEQMKHKKTVRSGFRVIKAKTTVNGQQNFYLNGERLRLRSAIDWGYYALTGMYATERMAKKSVMAAKKIGHNAINFHRRIGEPLVLKMADKHGLYLYEEPGGFHDVEEAMAPEKSDQRASMNVSWFRPEDGSKVNAASFQKQDGIKTESSSEGGQFVGWIEQGDRVQYKNVDFGNDSSKISFRVASNRTGPQNSGGRIEIYRNDPDGKLLGTATVPGTGGWQNWTSVTANIFSTGGNQTIWLVFRRPKRKPETEDKTTLTETLMLEKCRRMVIRDRNHPSLLFYNLSNEDTSWNSARKHAMKMMAGLDGSRFIFNSSGGHINPHTFRTHHIRPYEDKIRMDFLDRHPLGGEARFQEKDLQFWSHEHHKNRRAATWGRGKIDYLSLYGEVRFYTGPDNAYAIVESDEHPNRDGYDLNIYKPVHDKIEDFYNTYDFPETGSKVITSPEMLTKQAGRGLMYMDGRIGQIIMSNNSQDGYAINGWSGGPQVKNEFSTPWKSAITDEGRNLKGPASDLSYWIRKLQIAVFRKNGKYFNPQDSVLMDIYLINENKLKSGDYTLKIKVKDGSGEYTDFSKNMPVHVKGGDTYAQLISKKFEIVPKENWHAGYITLEAELYKDDKQITYGTEQVLLQNRSSYSSELKSVNGLVNKWPAAEKAISDAGGKIEAYGTSEQDVDYILAGKPAGDETFKDMLKHVDTNGSKLIIKFDSSWADKLVSHELLKSEVKEWGGSQTGHYTGYGWGYIDHYVSNQPIPSGSIIGTNSWEVPSDPYGFYPFESEYDLKVYGTYFGRPDTILVLLGKINYGKGSILLCPTYAVDQNNPFNDLLFYNLVLKGL